MATAVNNTKTNSSTMSSGTRTDKYKIYLQVTENSYDITTNKSNVTYKGWIQGTTTATTFYGYSMTGTIKNGNTTLASGSATATSSKPVSSANAYTLASGTSDFSHDSEGKLTLRLTFTYSSTAPHATAGSVTTELTLTTIPRASTIIALDCDIESSTSITINKANANFTTTLQYTFGTLSGTLVEKTANNVYGWTIPSSFYAQIPNSKTGTVTIRATTYNGTTSLGTTSTTFTVRANETKCKPNATLSVIDSNGTVTALTGDNSKIVPNYSNASATITRSAKNSATLTSVTLNGINIGTSATTYTINKTSTNVFTLVVTDSRGYSTTVTTTKTLINYIPLTLKATLTRNTPTDGKVNISYSGNYFNSSFGSVANTLTIQYRYRENGATTYGAWQTLTPTKSGNTYSQNVMLGQTFDYTKAYQFEVRAVDKLNTGVVVSSVVNRGIPVYWWNRSSFNIEVDNVYIKGKNIKDMFQAK